MPRDCAILFRGDTILMIVILSDVGARLYSCGRHPGMMVCALPESEGGVKYLLERHAMDGVGMYRGSWDSWGPLPRMDASQRLRPSSSRALAFRSSSCAGMPRFRGSLRPPNGCGWHIPGMVQISGNVARSFLEARGKVLPIHLHVVPPCAEHLAPVSWDMRTR
jgi:hypothetical protein